jgi:predicted aspartyl protease
VKGRLTGRKIPWPACDLDIGQGTRPGCRQFYRGPDVFRGYRSALVTGVAMGALWLGPVEAQANCKLNSINAPVQVEGLRLRTTVKINGDDAHLLVDSGAYFNSIAAKFAQDKKLQPVKQAVTGSHIASSVEQNVTGVGGVRRTGVYVIAPSLEIVHSKFKDVPFMTIDIGDADGLLGQNFLHAFDDEYDLKNGVLRLVQPEDCKASNLAYWAKTGTAYSVMPLETGAGDDRETKGYVTINGVKLRAAFDTGSPRTFITIRAAARAGVKSSDPGVKPNGEISGVDRDHIKTWLAPFASVKIGDEEIKNTRLVIGDTNPDGFDVLIGMDFFLSHHIYVANSQDKLYFTYEGGQVFKISPGDGASAAAPAEK